MKLIILMLIFISACSAKKVQPSRQETAKNLIYYVGDGMGPAQLTGGRYYLAGPKGQLNIEKLPYTGFVKTYSTDQYVTDSAAAATALVTGVKSYNGAISVTDSSIDPKGSSRRLETLMDVAIKAGKSVGIVTTAKVTHATPAVLYAHSDSRKKENNIATQLVDSPLTLVLGGGREHFLPKEMKDPESNSPSERKDDRHILQEMQYRGWTYIRSKQEFLQLKGKTAGKKVIGVFSASHMSYELDRHLDPFGEPSLSEMVEFAIEMLKSNPKGYFLFVESGRIDHASHFNFTRKTFSEVIEFDKAVGVGLEKSTDDTLVVVTADHETSGLSILGYGPIEMGEGENLLKANSRDLRKKNDLHAVVSWGSGPGIRASKKQNIKEANYQSRSTYYKETGAHSAVDVLLAAKGPGAFLFTGWKSNHDIPMAIVQAMGMSFTSKINEENRQALKRKKFH